MFNKVLSASLLFLAAFSFYNSAVLASVQTPKKGVAGAYYPNAILNTPDKLKEVGVSWFYDWHAESYGFDLATKSCTEFVPMIRYQASSDFRASYINSVTKKGAYWLIGNEPDQAASEDSDGKRASAEELITAYVKYAKTIKALDPTAKLIFGGFVTPGEYISQTQTQPPGYNIARLINDSLKQNNIKADGWHIHQYNCCNVDNFKKSLASWKEWQNRILGGGETWITEMGWLETRSGMENWMKEVVNYMETNSNSTLTVNRYAWFSLPTFLKKDGTPAFGNCGLYNTNGSISSLGLAYASLPTSSTATPRLCSSTTPSPTTQPSPTPTTNITPTPSPTPQLTSTQRGWNKISLNNPPENIFTNCRVTSKKETFWKIFKTASNPGKPYYTKCN